MQRLHLPRLETWYEFKRLEGPIRCGSRDWTVEMVGREGYYILAWTEYDGAHSVQFDDHDKARESAQWIANGDGVENVTLTHRVHVSDE